MTNNQTRLWRVEWVHRSGYLAPHYWVEAKKGKDEKTSRKNAILIAKQKSRLADFPKVWYCKITEEIKPIKVIKQEKD